MNDLPDEYQVDGEEEYEQRRKELIEEAQETKQQYDEQHAELLDAVESGEEFQVEDYEWVNLGELEIKVKTWFPGDTLDKLTSLEEGDATAQESINATIEAFTKLTEQIRKDDPVTDREGIESFWLVYYDKWGSQGLFEAMDVIASPAIDNSNEKQVRESFRGSER